jgi:hypothetical protein
VNAGQFRAMLPWGRVVLRGREFLPPGSGPLSVTVSIDSGGAIGWSPAGTPVPTRPQWAFQSFPVIVRDGDVPEVLHTRGPLIDVTHRDARLALGRLANGRLLVALTRFDALGRWFGSVPFGLTVPEMAAVMGALGARDAVLLDGGISAQLVAGQGTSKISLAGWRDVPLALIARRR